MKESNSDTCVRGCVTFICAGVYSNGFKLLLTYANFANFYNCAALKKKNLYNFSKAVIIINADICVINEDKFHSRRI